MKFRDIRKMKRVRIVASPMSIGAFNLHVCIKPGYIFGVKRAYVANTRAKTPMYELCGAAGKPVGHWGRYGNKIMRKWTEPVSTWEYLCERYGPNPLRIITGAIKETLNGKKQDT